MVQLFALNYMFICISNDVGSATHDEILGVAQKSAKFRFFSSVLSVICDISLMLLILLWYAIYVEQSRRSTLWVNKIPALKKMPREGKGKQMGLRVRWVRLYWPNWWSRGKCVICLLRAYRYPVFKVQTICKKTNCLHWINWKNSK